MAFSTEPASTLLHGSGVSSRSLDRVRGASAMIVRDLANGVGIPAPAKLNLFLEILGRRPDGYHEIETLMVAVNLHDTLSVSDDPSGAIAFTCDDPMLPVGRDNLVVRAAERLKEATGCPR